MDKQELIEEVASDAVTVIAIGSIAGLGYHGVTDTFVIGSVAGLGGYAVLKKRSATTGNGTE